MNLLSSVAAWDTVAEGYSEVTVGLFQRYSDAALDLIPLNSAHRMADIGCGPGTLALTAADRVAHVTAIDFSENMISILKRTLAERGTGNVEPVVGDAQNLPFDDAIFDAAFSMFALIFFPDRARGFAELYRTLKPGGHVCVSSWVPITESPLLHVMLKAVQTINPDVPEPQYDVDSLENPEVLAAEMTAAGFVDVAVHRVESTARFASAEAYWSDMTKGAAPVAIMKRGMADDAWREKSEAAVATVETLAGPFPAALSATAFLATGRKQRSASHETPR